MTQPDLNAVPQKSNKKRMMLRVWGAGVVATLILVGGWTLSLASLESSARDYLDNVLVPQALKQKMVLRYEGLSTYWNGVYVHKPKIFVQANNERTQFETDTLRLVPAGLNSVRIYAADELVVSDNVGRLVVVGDGPLRAGVTLPNTAGLPTRMALALPHETMISLSALTDAASQKPLRFLLEQSGGWRMSYERKDDAYVQMTMQADDARVSDPESKALHALWDEMKLQLRILPKVKGAYGTTQKMEIEGLEFGDTNKPSQSMNSGAAVDLRWDSEADVALAPVLDSTTDVKTGLEYLVTRLTLNNATFEVANLPLARAKGELVATKDQPTPHGVWYLTLGAWKQLHMLLGMAGGALGEKQLLPALKTLEARLEAMGKRTPTGEIELAITHVHDGTIFVGNRTISSAFLNLGIAVISAFESGTEQSKEVRDPSLPPSPDKPR